MVTTYRDPVLLARMVDSFFVWSFNMLTKAWTKLRGTVHCISPLWAVTLRLTSCSPFFRAACFGCKSSMLMAPKLEEEIIAIPRTAAAVDTVNVKTSQAS
jgi:hypothetical protein